MSSVNTAFKIHFIIGGIIITSVKGHCTDIAIIIIAIMYVLKNFFQKILRNRLT